MGGGSIINKILTINQGGLVKKAYLIVYIIFMIYNMFMINGCSSNSSSSDLYLKIPDFSLTSGVHAWDKLYTKAIILIPNYDYPKYDINFNFSSIIDPSVTTIKPEENMNIFSIEYSNHPSIDITMIGATNITFNSDSTKVYGQQILRIERSDYDKAISSLDNFAVVCSLKYNENNAPKTYTQRIMFYFRKKMLIEVDYDSDAYHLIDSLRNNRSNLLGFDNLFDSVNMYSLRSVYNVPNTTDSALTTNLAIDIDTTEEIATGVGPYGYDLNENTFVHGFWTTLYSMDTLVCYEYSLGCHNSAEIFRNNHYASYATRTVHVIFSSRYDGSYDTSSTFGLTIKAFGNFKWNYNGTDYYNNYIYIFTERLFRQYYCYNYYHYANYPDSLMPDIHRAISVIITHELGHNIGHLSHPNDGSKNIMNTLQDLFYLNFYNRYFTIEQLDTIQEFSQFYFQNH